MAIASAPAEIRFEHWAAGQRALGLGVSAPRLSWIVPTADPDYAQASYQVEISRDDSAADVVTVESAEQVLVPWPTAPLRSRERVSVRVRVGDGNDWSAWSEAAEAEAGLLSSSDWIAKYVSPRSLGGLDMPAPVVHCSFDVPRTVHRARLYATAHGIYLPS